MPAHNEEPYLSGAVSEVIDGLRERRIDFEVIVVENGSTDDTAGLAERLDADHAEVRALSRVGADYGLALRAGFLAATGDLVCNFDVDYVDLAFLDTALDLMAPGGDAEPVIVVGSKRSPGAGDHRAAGRRAVTAVFSTVLRHGFGLGVSDTHGLKLLRRAPLEPLVARCRFGADIFDTELILRAERAGWEVTEVPVTVNEQRPPRTSIVRRIPRSLLGLCRLRMVLWREAHTT
jgi:glycosyltransferase involved in cell wall biosynthesis